MDEILYSDDPEVTRRWAKECLAAGLHRPGEEGVARYSLAGQGRIYRMAYLPGIAWVMYCDFVLPCGEIRKPKWQAFTRPDMRRRGICARLCELAGFPEPVA